MDEIQVNEEELRKILARKAGFESELHVADQLMSCEYDIQPNYIFHDQDENKWRELDVAAKYQRSFKIGERECNLSLVLGIQIKKTSRPAVFYGGKKGVKEELPSPYLLAFKHIGGLHLELATLIGFDRIISHERYARTGVLVGKSDIDTATIHGALVSSIKAVGFFRRRLEEIFLSGRNNNGPVEFRMYLPMLIVDGPMFECYREDNEIKLKSLNEIVVKYWTQDKADPVSHSVIVSNLSSSEGLFRKLKDDKYNGFSWAERRLKRMLED